MSGTRTRRKDSVVDGLHVGPRPWNQHDFAVAAELTDDESVPVGPDDGVTSQECEKPKALDPDASEVIARILARRRTKG